MRTLQMKTVFALPAISVFPGVRADINLVEDTVLKAAMVTGARSCAAHTRPRKRLLEKRSD